MGDIRNKANSLAASCRALIGSPALREVKITPSQRRRRYALRVINGDTLELCLPASFNEDTALAFVKKHVRYIRNRLKEGTAKYSCAADDTVWLFGKRYLVETKGGVYYLAGRERIECGVSVEEYVKRLLKTHGLSFLERYTRTMAGVCGLNYSKTGLTKNKRLWACCRYGAAGDGIFYRVYACLLPEDILRYLAVHELCHTKERNHSARFWALVQKYIPDYKEKRKALKALSPEQFESVFHLEK